MSTLAGRRERFRRWRTSPNRLLRALYQGVQGGLRGWRLLTDARVRAEWRLARSDRPAYQISCETLEERYPELFDHVRQNLGDAPGLRLLSFGCATGEEILSLARRFEHAQLTGADINPWCLAQCRRRLRGARFRFLDVVSDAYRAAGEFDAVFCLAVLQRTEHRLQPGIMRATHLHFADFERAIDALDAKLKPGGLFIIDNADFRFSDTRRGASYRVSNFALNRFHNPVRVLFDRDDRVIPGGEAMYRVFIKPEA